MIMNGKLKFNNIFHHWLYETKYTPPGVIAWGRQLASRADRVQKEWPYDRENTNMYKEHAKKKFSP